MGEYQNKAYVTITEALDSKLKAYKTNVKFNPIEIVDDLVKTSYFDTVVSKIMEELAKGTDADFNLVTLENERKELIKALVNKFNAIKNNSRLQQIANHISILDHMKTTNGTLEKRLKVVGDLKYNEP